MRAKKSAAPAAGLVAGAVAPTRLLSSLLLSASGSNVVSFLPPSLPLNRELPVRFVLSLNSVAGFGGEAVESKRSAINWDGFEVLRTIPSWVASPPWERGAAEVGVPWPNPTGVIGLERSSALVDRRTGVNDDVRAADGEGA